eukprot:1182531-Prorocentrum_minimum.AAC.1
MAIMQSSDILPRDPKVAAAVGRHRQGGPNFCVALEGGDPGVALGVPHPQSFVLRPAEVAAAVG